MTAAPATALVHTGEPPMQPALSVVRTDPLADAVRQFQSTLALGNALVKSGFLPKHVNSGEKAVAIILAGRELGIGPMLALRSISIVEGKPVVAADLQLARFKADGGRAEFETLDAEKAVLQLRHPNGDEHTETFTIADARGAGLLGKDVWKKYPKAMLRSRVITAGLKSVGYEPTCGVYDPEEAEAFTPKRSVPAGAIASTSSATASSSADAVVDAEVVDDDGVVRDFEWAKSFPFPFEVGKVNHLKPMGTLSVAHLESVAKWVVKKQAEKGDDTWHADTLEAMNMLLSADAKAHASKAAALVATDDDPPPAPIDTALAPGKIEDALDKPKPKPAKEPGVADLAKSISALIKHEKITEVERAEFIDHSAKATSLNDLKLLIGEIEAVIESRLDDAP